MGKDFPHGVVSRWLNTLRFDIRPSVHNGGMKKVSFEKYTNTVKQIGEEIR